MGATQVIRHFILLVIMAIVFPSCFCTDPKAVPVSVSGISETLLDSHMYQSYTTILYNFSLPHSFDKESLTFHPFVSKFQPHLGICDKTEFGNQCVQMHYLNQLLEGTFSTYFQGIFGDLNNDSIPFNYADCDVLKPHFGRSVRRSQAAVQAYISQLQACEFPVTTIQKPNLSGDTGEFYTNMSVSTGKVYAGLVTKTLEGFVASQNTHLATYGIFLLNQHLENMKWKEAMQQCQSGYIPRSLIPAQDLRDQINSVKQIEEKHYNLTIPLNSIETYYNLPLADCTLVDQKYFLVRVQVPVQITELELKLVQFQAIPFRRDAETCFVDNIQRKIFLVKNSNLFSESNCKPNEMCKIPKHGIGCDFEHNPCLSAFLSNSKERIQQYCTLVCIPYDSPTPVFKQISTDRLVMTMGSSSGSTSAYVLCNRKPTDQIKSVSTGALDITFPCGCGIVYNSKEIFKASQPCGSDYHARSIIPYEWENNSSSQSSAEIPNQDKHVDPASCCNNGNSTLHTLAGIILVLMLATIVLLFAFIYKVNKLEKIRYKGESSISFANNIYDEPRLL